VHLTQSDLLTVTHRPSCRWVGADVQNAASLQIAAKLGCNYATFGTVLSSQLHPQSTALGWGALGEILAGTEIACYALGGLNENHLPLAQAAGAAGIATKLGA
jgi:8-oxo-dGTP diphosphatase